MGYIAQPLQRAQLRDLSNYLRKNIGMDDRDLRFPVISFLEILMPVLFPRFQLEIIPVDDFPEQKHAETDVANHIISVREDVYYGAINGNGRDRMTIAHEIAHYILLVICGVKFGRVFGDTPVAAYQDPEWQAKALAGELMCPNHLISSLSVDEIMDKCGVSRQAAKFNLKISKGGGAY